MEAYLVSLVVTLLISLSSLVPVGIDARLSDEVTKAARKDLGPDTTVQVHVIGDPVLQLPFGVVPHLNADARHLKGWGFPISNVHVELDDVRVSPWTVFGHQPAHLLAPAPARVDVQLARADMQAALDLAVKRSEPGQLAFELPLLGKVDPQVVEAHIELSEGRAGVAGQVRLKANAIPKPFAISMGVAVEEGKYLVPVDPRVSLGGQAIPGFLLAAMTRELGHLITVQDLGLKEGWTLDSPAIAPDGVTLKAHGTLTDLRP